MAGKHFIFKQSFCPIWMGNFSSVSISPNIQLSPNSLPCVRTLQSLHRGYHIRRLNEIRFSHIPLNVLAGKETPSSSLPPPANSEIFYKTQKSFKRRDFKNLTRGAWVLLTSNTLLFQLLCTLLTQHKLTLPGEVCKLRTIQSSAPKQTQVLCCRSAPSSKK